MPAPRNVDWDGDGTANYRDEWIELYNGTAEEVDLGGWALDDRAGGGARPFVFVPGTRLGAGEYGLYFQRDTGIALNNDGDTVRLLGPQGEELDSVTYTRTASDASYSRAGGCAGAWSMGNPASPGFANPSPTATATATATATETPTATATAVSPTPTATPTPTPTETAATVWLPLLCRVD
jgi:hypothetical protein